jgi:hypothetical protein
MHSVLILGVGLLAATPSDVSTAVSARAVYEAAVTEAGRDPDAHVKLALWCEAHGLKGEQIKHLALAVLIDPRNTTARGLMGLVAYQGKWQRPEAVGATIKADELQAARLARYNARRERMADTAEAHRELALWCERAGLKPEATAHWTAVTRLDPGRDLAWIHLGYHKHRGHWMTPEQIDARIAEAEAQLQADRRWVPLLGQCKDWRRQGRADEAESVLAAVTDPRAAPAVAKVFAHGSADNQLCAVRLLGQIEGPEASRALARLAFPERPEEVQQAAREGLLRRDPREFVDLLLEQLRDVLHAEVQPPGRPDSMGVLLISSRSFRLRRDYTVLKTMVGAQERTTEAPDAVAEATSAAAWRNLEFGTQVAGPQPQLAVVLDRVAALEAILSPPTVTIEGIQDRSDDRARALVAARERLDRDRQTIEGLNAPIHARNAPFVRILEAVAGSSLGQDPEAWKGWWADRQGYGYREPGYTRRPEIVQTIQTHVVLLRPHSCFAAGTPVHTLSGTQAIETLRVGDQVLAQDTSTGALSFQPIVAVYHNPPNRTLQVRLGGETIVATGIHRFWKAGKGWTMARDLKPGDAVRTLGGTAEVGAVATDSVRPVFNLEVAGGHSLFVGTVGFLVHDNSLVQPVPHPFDAAPQIAALLRGGR